MKSQVDPPRGRVETCLDLFLERKKRLIWGDVILLHLRFADLGLELQLSLTTNLKPQVSTLPPTEAAVGLSMDGRQLTAPPCCNTHPHSRATQLK